MGELLHKGSVKDIYLGPSEEELIFSYSDRYSVFDWGEMPDQLENKGKALASMAYLFFKNIEDTKWWRIWKVDAREIADIGAGELLAQFQHRGMKHHMLGLCDFDGNEKKVPQGRDVEKFLKVKKVDVLKPIFREGQRPDYHLYQSRPRQSLIPLEVIFRFGAPAGSSLFNRVEDRAYLKTLGLANIPVQGEFFSHPIFEMSTKLESVDRYIHYDEGQTMAGLSSLEFADLRACVLLLALRLRDYFKDIGLTLWDGKFEFAFGEDCNGRRELILVDSIGIDELRLTMGGVSFSKELLRSFYRGGPWFQGLERAKALAKERSVADWKSLCLEELDLRPAALSAEQCQQASMIYTSLAQRLWKERFGNDLFAEAWSLDHVVKQFS